MKNKLLTTVLLVLILTLTGCSKDPGECTWREHVQIVDARLGQKRWTRNPFAITTYCVVPFNGEPLELEFEGHIGEWVDLCEYRFEDGHVELRLEYHYED